MSEPVSVSMISVALYEVSRIVWPYMLAAQAVPLMFYVRDCVQKRRRTAKHLVEEIVAFNVVPANAVLHGLMNDELNHVWHTTWTNGFVLSQENEAATIGPQSLDPYASSFPINAIPEHPIC